MKTLLVLSFLQSLVVGDEYDHSSRNSYSYQYNVADPKTLNNFEVAESGDPEVVTGSYKVDLPDGRRQIVSYSVHPKEGYHAEVTYIGEAKYPDSPLYGATPYGPPEPIHRYGNPKFKRQLPKRKSIHFPFPAKKAANKKKASAPQESPVQAFSVEKASPEANSDLFAEPSEINYERPERTVVAEKTDSATEARDQKPLKLAAVSSEENSSRVEESHPVESRVGHNAALENPENEPEPLPEPLSLRAQPQVTENLRVGKFIDWSNCKNLDDCLTSLEIVDDTKPSTKVKMTELTVNDHVKADSEEETEESELLEEFEVDVNDDLLSEIYKIESTTAKRYSYNPTTSPPLSSSTLVPASSSTVKIHAPLNLSPNPSEKQRKRNVGQNTKFNKVLYRTDVSRKPSAVQANYYRPRYVAHYDTVFDVNVGRPDLKPVEFAKVHPYEYPSYDGNGQKASSIFRKSFRENTFKSVVENEAEKALDANHEDIDYFEDYNIFPFGARIESVVVPTLNQLPEEPTSNPASTSDLPSASSRTEAFSPTEAPTTKVMTTLVDHDHTVPPSTTTVTPTVTPVHRNKKVRLISKGNTFVPEYVPTF